MASRLSKIKRLFSCCLGSGADPSPEYERSTTPRNHYPVQETMSHLQETICPSPTTNRSTDDQQLPAAKYQAFRINIIMTTKLEAIQTDF